MRAEKNSQSDGMGRRFGAPRQLHRMEKIMNIKIFTIPFSKERKQFDDSEMRKFLEGKDVSSVNQNMIFVDGAQYWAVLVKYEEKKPAKPQEASDSKESKAAHNDPAKADEKQPPPPLTLKEKEGFELLRKWRYAVAESAGVPLYAVCHNKELELIARAWPKDLPSLKNIKGLRPFFVTKYGQDIISAMK
jgi:superfamily II DNA helicase RecQ